MMRPARQSKELTPAVDEPGATMVESPVEAPNERRARKDAIRAENAERKERPVQADEGRSSRDDKADRRNRREDADGVLGFGDDMPAFMRIAAKV